VKKFYYFLFLILFLFLVGCEKALNIHIQADIPKENIISSDETFRLKYFIVNPTINTFVGHLNYKYEDSCLNIVGTSINESIEVNPKDKIAIVKEFNYHPSRSRNVGCIQVPLKVNVILEDRSGLLRDSYETTLTITQ